MVARELPELLASGLRWVMGRRDRRAKIVLLGGSTCTGILAGVLAAALGSPGTMAALVALLTFAAIGVTGAALLAAALPQEELRSASWLQERLAPLELRREGTEAARVNVLIPAIDVDHMFGGYLAILELADGLARRGSRVRLVALDQRRRPRAGWQRAIESSLSIDGTFERVEVAFPTQVGRGLTISPADTFVATSWWTAHLANAAAGELGSPSFVYLIQERESLLFPHGSYSALAEETYRFSHLPVFSTGLLRDHFREQRLGVFAVDNGGEGTACFQNALTSTEPPSRAELETRDRRRLLFYARPEQHAARNMFALGLLALRRAAENGTFGDEWELLGVGATDPGRRRLQVAPGLNLRLLTRGGLGTYAGLLRSADAGLALMNSPHPSLVPVEMAAAAMPTVTTVYDESKSASRLREISPNLLPAEPTIGAISDALAEAVERAMDAPARLRGARVTWPRAWDAALTDELLDTVEGFLERCRPS